MDQKMAQAVYDQAMKLWFEPYILEKHEKERISLPVVVRAAQITFGLDGSHTVRLNSEFKGKLVAKLKKDLKEGEVFTYNDVEDLHMAERHPDDLDFGHITLVSQGENQWNISFSFQYGVDKIKRYLDVGKEYLDSAFDGLKGSGRVAIALGMTAAENLIKARMAASPIARINSTSHKHVVNMLGQFSNTPKVKINPEYNSALKFFNKHFNGVRYEPGYPHIHKATLKKNISILKRLYNETFTMVNGVNDLTFKQRRIRISKPDPRQA